MGDAFGIGGNPQIATGWGGGRHTTDGGRNLGKGKVFGELLSRKASRRALQQSVKGTSGGLRPHGASRKVSRDVGPRECFRKMRAIDFGRAQQDGNAIERHTSAREGEDSADNFDALASLSWCREYLDFVAGVRLRRFLVLVEKVTLETS
jgi:hypothetical protein